MAKKKYSKEFEANSGRFRSLSSEEASKLGKKGAEEREAKKQEERTFQATMIIVLNMPASKQMKDAALAMGCTKDFVGNMTIKDFLSVSAIKHGVLKGDIKELVEFAKLLGEYTETLKVDGLPETPVGDRLFTKKEKE